MSKVKTLVAQLKPHEPIYSIEINPSGTNISFNFLNEPPSVAVDPNDKLAELVEENKREIKTHGGKFTIDQTKTLDNIYSTVRMSLINYIKKMSSAKQPTNQSVYQWLADKSYRTDDKLFELLVEVYLYVISQPTNEIRRNTKTAHNFMNLMEFIRCQK